MIGELFTINKDNIVRAAIAVVTKDLLPSDPVEVAARPHEKDVDALILVTGSEGKTFKIAVHESTIADCLQEEDTRASAQELVDQLATEIRHFVDEVLGSPAGNERRAGA